MANRPPEPSPLRPRARFRGAALAVAGVVLLLVGFVVGQRANEAPSGAPQASPTTVPTTDDVGPRTVVDGVPLGYARTEAGAVAAATTFTEIMATAADDPDAHVAAMEAIAAPEWRERAAELARNTIDFLGESYPDATLSFAPVRYDVVVYSPDAATVKVWGVTVIFPPEGRPEQAWVTGTLRLVWLEDWRMNGGGSSGGPTPFVLESPEDLDWRTINGFTDVGDGRQP